MQSIAELNNALLSQIEPELVKATKAARIRDAFAHALMAACDTPESARFMLKHVQAVYVMHDDTPMKPGAKSSPILLRIYSDDATVRAEIDARQEWIRINLARQGITYDRMRLHASSFGMRQRKPFERFLRDGGKSIQEASDVERHTLNESQIEALVEHVEDGHVSQALREALVATSSTDSETDDKAVSTQSFTHKQRYIMVEQLEVLKRAFCLVFGTEADSILDKINAAYLIPVSQQGDDKRKAWQSTRCVLYSSDPRLATVISAYGDQVRGEARRLGLYTRGAIRVLPAPQKISQEHAFPPLGSPIIIDISD